MESSIAARYSAVHKVITFTGSGSGFLIRQPNYFITNYHGVEGHHVVSLEDQDENRYRAQVVLVSPSHDLAVLTAEGDFSSLAPTPIAEAGTVELGDRMTVAGFPFGKPFSVTEGIVSSPRQRVDNRYLIQTDAAVNPGNSGGPMFNANGEVVAVTVSKMVDAENVGYGIPVSDLQKVLATLDSITDKEFHVQCSGCDTPIATEQEFCTSCGAKLSADAFKETKLSPLAELVEGIIANMGIDPVTARVGKEFWRFYRGSAQLSMYVYNTRFLIFYSNVNTLPKKDLGPVLGYLLSNPVPPYQFSLRENDLVLYYCVHLADLDSPHRERISQELTDLAKKADDLDNYLLDTYGCPLPERKTVRSEE